MTASGITCSELMVDRAGNAHTNVPMERLSKSNKKALTDGNSPGTFFNKAMTCSLAVMLSWIPRLIPAAPGGGGGFDDDEPS